jgi:hypothetical protein
MTKRDAGEDFLAAVAILLMLGVSPLALLWLFETEKENRKADF